MIYHSVFGFFLLEGWGRDPQLQNTESLLALGSEAHKQCGLLQVPSQRLSYTAVCSQSSQSLMSGVCWGWCVFWGLSRAAEVAVPRPGLAAQSGSTGDPLVPLGWAAISKETVWLLPGASRSCLSTRQFPKPLADFPLWTVHLSGNGIGYRISRTAKPH